MADLEDVRRWGRIVLGAALRPLLYPIGGLVFGIAMVAHVLINRRRNRRRYRKLARTLGIDQGRILSWTYTQDAAPPLPKLQVACLRAGRWQDVLGDLTERAQRARYRVPALDLPADRPPLGLSFRSAEQERLPSITVSVYSYGETIQPHDVVVPEGKTGLHISLG